MIQQSKITTFIPILALVLLLFVNLNVAAGLMLVIMFQLWLYFEVGAVNRNLFYIVAVAFFFRSLLVLANEYLGFLPLQPDALQYITQAMQIVENQLRKLPLV